MDAEPDVARTGVLLADRTRMAFLHEIAARGPQSVGALARAAGVSPSVASQHVSRLAAGGLVTVRAAGRIRMVAIASAAVADALEALSRISPPRQARGLTDVSRAEAFRNARSCYDHLAGRLGVGLFDAMREQGWIVPAGEPGPTALDVSRAGEDALGALGADVRTLRHGRRAVARGCLDCTESRPHLAGGAGALLLNCLLERGWLTRGQGRALHLSDRGRDSLTAWLGRDPLA